MVFDPLGDNNKNSGVLERVAPGGEGGPTRRCLEVSRLRGAWRLESRVPLQAVWKRVSPGGSGVAPGNIVEAEIVL